MERVKRPLTVTVMVRVRHVHVGNNAHLIGAFCLDSGCVPIMSDLHISEGSIRRTRSRTGAKAPSANRNTLPMCAEVSDVLYNLQHTDRVYRLKVIADGRCSVAAVLLALRLLQDEHVDRQCPVHGVLRGPFSEPASRSTHLVGERCIDYRVEGEVRADDDGVPADLLLPHADDDVVDN
jgi:hypothetical protein